MLGQEKGRHRMNLEIPDCKVRADFKSRSHRTFTYQQVDRVPDMEFGYWPQTIRRWLKEGMDLELTEDEQNAMFSGKIEKFFGNDTESTGDGVHLRMHMNPTFEEEIIEERPDSIVKRDGSGQVAELYTNDSENSSIPHYIGFPVETPEDWEEMKGRFRKDDESRVRPEEEISRLRQSVADGKSIGSGGIGPYGQLRNWMGFENLSIAFYEYPDMIHDMVEHWTDLFLQQIRSVPKDIPIDSFSWWEDMASKNGPFVGPDMFREFIQPCYHKVMSELKDRHCVIATVDCDGNPHDLVANWLEEGVNIMFPLEVAAGVDPYAWREEFGLELRLQGGIDKRAVAQGGSAIDKELERVRPLLEQGGYIPHLDHLVPPDVSYRNYQEYLEKKRRLIGK